MTINQKGFGVVFILIGVVILIVIGLVGGYIRGSLYIKNSKPSEPVTINQPQNDNKNQINPSPRPTPEAVETVDLYKKGLYINPTLNVVFDYPSEWSLSSKSIGNKGDVEISFEISGQNPANISSDFFIAKISKGQNQLFIDFIERSKTNLSAKFEKKTINRLDGYLIFEQLGPALYKENFVAVYANSSFMFYIQANPASKDAYNGLLEKVVSTVRGYDKSGYQFPTYHTDNIVINSKISAPSYLPAGFGLIFEKKLRPEEVQWSYSMNVTDAGSGVNDLNIWEKLKGSEYILYAPSTVSLENALNLEVSSFVGEERLKAKEEVDVKGHKGYYIGRPYIAGVTSGQPSRSGLSGGYLVFETDKSVVLIVAGEYVDPTKSELLKIAESMVH